MISKVTVRSQPMKCSCCGTTRTAATDSTTCEEAAGKRHRWETEGQSMGMTGFACPRFRAFQMLNAFVDEFLSAEEKRRIFPSYPHSPSGHSYLAHHADAIHKHAKLIGAELSKSMYQKAVKP